MEPTQANVRSIEALERLRAALARCLDDLKVAVSESEAEVRKAESWVFTDRLPHWHQRQQRLAEEVNSARSALFRKETVTSSKDSKPSVVDEKKALDRARGMLEDAISRGRRSKAWSIEMPREQAAFKRSLSPLATMIDREIPAGLQALGRMIEALERYRGDAPPDLVGLFDVGGAPTNHSAGMARSDADRPPVSNAEKTGSVDGGTPSEEVQ